VCDVQDEPEMRAVIGRCLPGVQSIVMQRGGSLMLLNEE
jgi:hypothetical protein